MTLEQICVTKEWAEKLKEAGYPQESLHWWGGIGNMGIWCDHVKDDLPAGEKRFNWFAAPTASEILEKLPEEIDGDWLRISTGPLKTVKYQNFGYITQNVNLVNALAAMYCYLAQKDQKEEEKTIHYPNGSTIKFSYTTTPYNDAGQDGKCKF